MTENIPNCCRSETGPENGVCPDQEKCYNLAERIKSRILHNKSTGNIDPSALEGCPYFAKNEDIKGYFKKINTYTPEEEANLFPES